MKEYVDILNMTSQCYCCAPKYTPHAPLPYFLIHLNLSWILPAAAAGNDRHRQTPKNSVSSIPFAIGYRRRTQFPVFRSPSATAEELSFQYSVRHRLPPTVLICFPFSVYSSPSATADELSFQFSVRHRLPPTVLICFPFSVFRSPSATADGSH
ncbi:MAG: hypothetical protein OEM82_08220 [Acidobacteriota bacterium]|nr:hypothetical protein [Acidobacteriota bacterium]